MTKEYLPGNVRDRIQDLMKERKVTQKDLAKLAGCNESTLSRFLTGKSDKLSDENIIAIAGAFEVTTDFLLGLTNIPDRTNYDLAELGLSVEAGKALYTSPKTAAAVNAMLGSKSFPAMAELICQYMEGTSAEGYAAQNRMYSILATMTAGKNSAVADYIRSQRTPVYQADVAYIEKLFGKVLQEIRQNHAEKIAEAQKLTSDVMKQLVDNLPKGVDLTELKPEDIVGAITGVIEGTGSYTEEQLEGFRKGILPMFLSTPEEDANVDE